MDKYAVKTDTNEKTASAGLSCPQCGKKPERHGNVLKCPQCGTGPFENDLSNEEER